MKKVWYSVLLFIFFFFFPPFAHAAPPANFQRSLIIGSGLDGPSGFDIAPDGRIFILQRTGEIKIYKNGQLLSQNFAVLPSTATGDRGLIGIAFDPDFLTNHYVYFYYTGLDLHNYLVRFNASGDTATDGPVILYQTSDESFQLHVGGTIRFGPDGKLYISIGDNGYAPNAQDLSNPHGKILRLNKDGSIPLDNPFVGQIGKLPEIWAYGFRNPFRFTFDSATGRMYEGDVGEATWEEINRVEAGKDYGWPLCEGFCNPPNSAYTDPIYDYNHNGGSAAVMAGVVYHGQMFPPEYQGRLFFGDYAEGFIRTMALDANGNNAGVSDFDTAAGSVVDMKVDPKDGSLYYITYIPGALYQITYSTGNHVPVANETVDATKGIAPLTLHFSSSGSYDPDGTALTYLWDFGDGTTSTEANPTKIYNTNGQYTVQLKVSDGVYTTLAVPIIIQVGIPPKVTIGMPADKSMYNAGDVINYSVSAVDGAGFDISDGSLSTTVVFHHQTHIHPFLGPLTGRSGSFTIPNTGEVSPDTWYEIDATATDTSGLTSTAVVNIYPNKANMTFTSNVSGISMLLDGIPTALPQTIQGVVGFLRQVSTPMLQVVNNVVYEFNHWSDNGVPTHTITTPSTDTTYTAYFNQSQPFKGEYFSNMTLSGTPTLTRDDPQINFNWDQGSPDPSIPTDNFSVRWTKSQYFPQGTYTFTTSTDDGVRLYVDNNLVIDKWQDQATTAYTATVQLTDGNHDIRMEYYEHMGGAVASLSWAYVPDQGPTATPTPTPTPLPPVDHYDADYFTNQTLSGSPAVSRDESDLNHDWGTGSPDPAIPADHFSARWTRVPSFAAGTYTFSVTSDDGVRIFIDGTKVLDKWVDQPATTYAFDQTLTAGSHTLVVEYYENTGGAVIKFTYAPKSTPTPTPTPAPTTRLGGLDLDSYCHSLGQVQAQLSNNTWACSGNNAPIDITAACIWQYANQSATAVQERTGDPYSWACYTSAQQAGYQAQYWNLPGTGSAPTLPSSAPILTRSDNEINFDWGSGSPDPAITPDHFGARWTRTMTFDPGTYTFTATSDDGVRVYLDGTPLIDQWNDHSKTTYTATQTLTGGSHTITVEYYENTGGALMQFSYAPAQASSTFTGEYFDNQTLSGTPKLVRNDDRINFNWGYGSPDPSIPADHFSVRWTKQEQYNGGTYSFTLKSDDGIRFWVDNTLLVDDWTNHSLRTYTPQITLTAGLHTLKIEYYENDGSAVAILTEN